MKKVMITIVIFIFSSATAYGWEYATHLDKMRGTKDKLAYVNSINKVSFDFPYNGGSKLRMIINGPVVNFVISKGQFDCPEKCNLNIKIDDKKIEQFQAVEVSRDQIMFAMFPIPELMHSRDFVLNLKSAKKLIVEVDFYEEGYKQFTFNVGGLDYNRIDLAPNNTQSP